MDESTTSLAVERLTSLRAGDLVAVAGRIPRPERDRAPLTEHQALRIRQVSADHVYFDCSVNTWPTADQLDASIRGGELEEEAAWFYAEELKIVLREDFALWFEEGKIRRIISGERPALRDSDMRVHPQHGVVSVSATDDLANGVLVQAAEITVYDFEGRWHEVDVGALRLPIGHGDASRLQARLLDAARVGNEAPLSREAGARIHAELPASVPEELAAQGDLLELFLRHGAERLSVAEELSVESEALYGQVYGNVLPELEFVLGADATHQIIELVREGADDAEAAWDD